MARKNDELLKRLLATFRVEAGEHLQAMTSGLLALEKSPSAPEAAAIVETIFREAHSLKGAARAVNLSAIEALCQSLESIFAALKKAQIAVSLPLLDLLHQALDALAKLLSADPETASTPPPAISALMRTLGQAANGSLPAGSSGPPLAPAAADLETAAAGTAVSPAPAAFGHVSSTVRISTAKLDAVMRQVEELLSPRLAAHQRALELHDTAETAAAWKKARAQIQPALRQIERAASRMDKAGISEHGRKEIAKVLEYLEREQLFMASIEERLSKLGQSAARDRHMLTGMTDSLLNDVKEMQLLPFGALFEALPRQARELAREQGKEVELAMHGGEIEIDRRILEELKDPLTHLLRNAVDHGIETPAARAAGGKRRQGVVTLSVSQRDGGKVEVLFADDGAGIDGERVKAAARKLGMLSGEEGDGIGEREAFALAFQSGVSTSPIITDVSGRGLGLAIVREKIERLGGTVSIESQHGSGTAFHIVLPLSLATFHAVLVRAGEQVCAVPSAGVERVARPAAQDIRTVENRETIVLDEAVVALADLDEALEIPRPATREEANHTPVIVLGGSDTRIAFRVDEILGEQEILVKPLGPQLARVRNVAGATLLGSGRVVPVLNVADLLKSAMSRVTAPRLPAAAAPPESGAKRSILVVEDSITSRSLLKNILESAGYAVATAVDGMDAFAALKTAAFDLVVSDVEMPRMDGFDLTARIRADKQLAELPVVLVTALESREHRERGIDVGANAYIVKSSFDQSNLLEVIRRMI